MASIAEVFGPQGQQILDLIQVAGAIEAPDGTLFQSPPDENPDYDGALGLVDDILIGMEDLLRGQQVDAARNAVHGAVMEPTLERPEFQLHAGVAAFRAATGLAARDLLDLELYNKLTIEWRANVGKLHPDDVDPR